MMPHDTIEVLGYELLCAPASAVAAEICTSMGQPATDSFAFLNPHSIALAKRDPALKKAIAKYSGLFCDGIGLSMACRLLNGRGIYRVYGYEFFMALSTELSRRRLGHVFFLGGTPASMEALCARYAAEFPGIKSTAFYAPPFKQEFSENDIADMGARIAAAGADVLWIGLGSPKQEKILHPILSHCRVRCAAAVGAVFDYYSERVPHPPAWIRRLGLQWVYRLLLEPRRLWKRTFVSGPAFASEVAKELIRRYVHRPGR
jgi:N-acetylglucosaminyldiphosphoundecaprenol N-acetyl-beta-D-mannosaminyltransferase